jgi:peptide/nickel transport system substrate-binding protein
MLPRRPLLLGAAALAAASLPARAQKFRDALRVSWSDGLDTLDPYRTPLRTGLALMQEIWDGLLWRDPDTLELRPLLATYWHAPDPVTWDFTLRPGVRFHDGSPFGPEDVVATVRRVLGDDRLGIPANYRWLRGAEVIGDGRVRLTMRHPFPPALDFIAGVLPILPRDAEPETAVGTGPWRLDDFDPRTRHIALVRHEAYWAGSPKGRARIARLDIDQPDDPATPYNDLISGRVDWIWQLTPDEFDAIQQAAELQALRADSMRVAYLALDAAGRSDPDGPLTFLPVRQAVCHAVDRAALAGLAAPGGARVIDTPCFPTQYGCDPAAATPYRLDRARAHQLLQNAGLPDGFATTLVTNARPELAAAVAHDLTKIGIATTARTLSPAEAMAKAAAGRAPLFLGSWGSSSINDMAAFLPEFFDGGALDYARLPGLADLVERAGQTLDADDRRALYAHAIADITDAACWLPLFVDAASYGIDRSLSFHPTPDELPRFFRMRWR